MMDRKRKTTTDVVRGIFLSKSESPCDTSSTSVQSNVNNTIHNLNELESKLGNGVVKPKSEGEFKNSKERFEISKFVQNVFKEFESDVSEISTFVQVVLDEVIQKSLEKNQVEEKKNLKNLTFPIFLKLRHKKKKAIKGLESFKKMINFNPRRRGKRKFAFKPPKLNLKSINKDEDEPDIKDGANFFQKMSEEIKERKKGGGILAKFGLSKSQYKLKDDYVAQKPIKRLSRSKRLPLKPVNTIIEKRGKNGKRLRRVQSPRFFGEALNKKVIRIRTPEHEVSQKRRQRRARKFALLFDSESLEKGEKIKYKGKKKQKMLESELRTLKLMNSNLKMDLKKKAKDKIKSKGSTVSIEEYNKLNDEFKLADKLFKKLKASFHKEVNEEVEKLVSRQLKKKDSDYRRKIRKMEKLCNEELRKKDEEMKKKLEQMEMKSRYKLEKKKLDNEKKLRKIDAECRERIRKSDEEVRLMKKRKDGLLNECIRFSKKNSFYAQEVDFKNEKIREMKILVKKLHEELCNPCKMRFSTKYFDGLKVAFGAVHKDKKDNSKDKK